MRRIAKQPHSRIPLPGRPGACQLRVQGLGVTLEGSSILQDVSFQLNCREITALIGPNGAGKSSLFRSILGQIPYSGSIRFELAGGYPSRPKIGYVPQSPSFERSCPVSVLDFFAAAIARWPVFLPVPSALREKVTECLTRVHAEALLKKRIGSLSGGELQRVLLALALEPIPQILILDEPLSGVDMGGEHLLMEMLDEIRRTYDLSILFSTHDFSTLQLYADQVILLQQQILTSGTPAQVLGSTEFRSVFHLDLGKKGGEAP
ncbi:MAG: metal ABC transporter ATP-binding protein [Ruminiclostridium sp.]|nr:metal ABC transporter ATP-binding protein [Ruminiclostridium sp.]